MKRHDSYAAISLSRVSTGGGIDLFGSSIKNNTAIALRINEAEEDEYYGATKHWKKGRIIEVYLSPNQFSELITTMNISEGVPCTITWMRGKGEIERPKRTNAREVTEGVLRKTIKKTFSRLTEIQESVEALKKKSSVSKKDRENLSKSLSLLRQDLESDMPFVETIFNEVMDKSVTEAKADIDGMVTHVVTKLGLESLEQKRNLLED